MAEMNCWICQKNKIVQLPDGSGGYEIGISKWFSSIEPWGLQLPMCKTCFKKLAKHIGLMDDDVERVEKQTPKKETV